MDSQKKAQNSKSVEDFVHSGNQTTVPPDARVISKYVGQPISETSRVEKQVPLCSDINVKRERNWNIENKL